MAPYEREYNQSREATDKQAALDKETGRLFAPAPAWDALSRKVEEEVQRNIGRGGLDRLVSDKIVRPGLATADRIAQTALVKVLGDVAWSDAKMAVRNAAGFFAPEAMVPSEALALLRETKTNRQLGQEIGKDALDALTGKGRGRLLGVTLDAAENTPENQKLLFRFLIGEVKADQLSGNVRLLGEKVKATIENLRSEQLRDGLMSRETYERYKGKYLPTLYVDKERDTKGVGASVKRMLTSSGLRKPRLSDKFLILKDGEAMDARGKVISREGSNTPGFTSAQERDEFLDRLVSAEWLKAANAGQFMQGQRVTLKTLANLETEALPSEAKLALENLRASIEKRFTTRDPMTDTDYSVMGRIEDPGYLAIRAITASLNDLAMSRLFAKIDARADWISDAPRSDKFGDFRQLPTNPRLGPLSGKYVTKGIAQEINDSLAEQDAVVEQLYDSALTAWKYGKTVLNPGTHVRNVIGNQFFASLAGVSPANPANWIHYKKAAEVLMGGRAELYRELVETGMLGGNSAQQSAMERFSEIDRARFLAGFTLGKSPNIVALVGKLAVSQAGKANNAAARLYNLEDELFKVAAFIKARSNGASAKQSREHVRTWFPDYQSSLSSGANRRILRRFMPFYGFTKETVRIVANAALNKPVTLAAWSAAPMALSTLSAYLLGLEDEDREKIAAAMRGKVFGVPVFSLLLPFRDGDGRLVQLDLTNSIPMASIPGFRLEARDETDNAFSVFLRQVLLSSPAVNLGLGLSMQRDSYFDRRFVQTGMSGGEIAAENVRYVAKTLLPPLLGRDVLNAVLPGAQTPAPTVLNPGGIERGTLKKRSPTQFILRALGGIDVRSADPRLGDLIDDFKKKNNLPSSPTLDDNTARGRARGRLYQAVLDEDVGRTARELKELRTLGAPIATVPDLKSFIDDRNPLRSIRTADRARFVRELPKQTRESVLNTLREFERVKARAGKTVAEAYKTLKSP